MVPFAAEPFQNSIAYEDTFKSYIKGFDPTFVNFVKKVMVERTIWIAI